MHHAKQIGHTPSMRLGKHPRRHDHSAIIAAGGEALATFGVNDTRIEISAMIAASGYVLQDDDSITEAS